MTAYRPAILLRPGDRVMVFRCAADGTDLVRLSTIRSVDRGRDPQLALVLDCPFCGLPHRVLLPAGAPVPVEAGP